MKPILLLALMTAGGAALAQQGPYADETSCKQFLTMDTATRLGLLSQIEPLGDDIEPDDRQATDQWVHDVSKACEGHPEMALTAAAEQAMTTE